MNAPLTPQDWEFLSTYLDGQLSPAEARRAQDVLARRPELGPALDELRRTRAVLRAASRRRAPRNFTLTPAMARQARPRSWFHFGWAPSLRFTSALATLLLVLSFFVRLPATGLPAAPLAAQAPMAAQADGFAAQEKAAANEASVPPIIIWNDGGRGAAGLGAGDSPAGALPRDLVLPQATPAGPQVGTTNNDATPTATPAARSAAALAQTASASAANTVILGVAPADQRGQMLTTVPGARSAAPPALPEPPAAQDSWLWMQVSLGLAALLSGLAAIALWRRTRF